MAGNLIPVTKSGEQLHLPFYPFQENRLPFLVKVKDPNEDAQGRLAFMKESKSGRNELPQVPICNLNVKLPDELSVSVRTSQGFFRRSMSKFTGVFSMENIVLLCTSAQKAVKSNQS